MNNAPAWYTQDDVVELGSLTTEMVPPVTGLESTAAQEVGVTRLQELGAPARATNGPLP
jgi:hypothetical protein